MTLAGDGPQERSGLVAYSRRVLTGFPRSSSCFNPHEPVLSLVLRAEWALGGPLYRSPPAFDKLVDNKKRLWDESHA